MNISIYVITAHTKQKEIFYTQVYYWMEEKAVLCPTTGGKKWLSIKQIDFFKCFLNDVADI